MPQRQIPHKRTLDLVVAHAPVHPPQEHHQLRPHRKHHDYVRQPRTTHVFSFGVRNAKPSLSRLKLDSESSANRQFWGFVADSFFLIAVICSLLSSPYKNNPGTPPSAPPRLDPSDEKNPPLFREEFARTFSSSAGIPSVLPNRLESMPNNPESPCNAAICRRKAVLLKFNWFCCARFPAATPFCRARSSVSSLKPAEFTLRAARFVADCCSESNALASAPCDCPVIAALSAALNPGLFKML